MKRILPIGLSILMMACSAPSKNAEEDTILKLKERVMTQHDVLMNSEAALMEAKRKLASHNDIDSTKRAGILTKMRETSDFMMNWMVEFKPEQDTLEEEKALKYFQQQETLLDSMAAMYQHCLMEAEKAMSDAK